MSSSIRTGLIVQALVITGLLNDGGIRVNRDVTTRSR
jgi:hypothetical protein